MPVAGRKPKPEGQRRHRALPAHEWIDVPDVPFLDAPTLPGGKWPQATARWWRAVSTMPHCSLWKAAEWQFALDTALIAAAFHSGQLALGAELRQRERILGTTADARRDLRIRYVDPAVEEEPASVTAIEEYRRRLAEPEGGGR